MKRQSFTLVELVISVGLLIVAMSIALIATIGSGGLIQKTDARSQVAEGARTLSDTLRRTVVNAPVGAVQLLGSAAADGTYSIVRVKAYSEDQGTTACYVVGRAVAGEVDGEETYTFSPTGEVAVYKIYGVDNAGLCPEVTSQPLYQNRLNDKQTKLTDFRAHIRTFPCVVQTATCFSKQQLRFWATIELVTKGSVGSTKEAKKPSLTFESSVPIGLVNQTQQALTVETLALADGYVGSPYNETISATGGAPAYSWSVISGNLPPGSPNCSLGSATGTISCTPNAVGTSNFTVRVTDTTGASATRSLSITVRQASTQVQITTSSPLSPAATELSYYQNQLEAQGGSGNYSWMLVPGAPNWLRISATGQLYTQPYPADGSAPSVTFTARVTEAENVNNFHERTFTLPINDNVTTPQPLAISSPSTLPSATENVSYSYQFAATGGTGSYTWGLEPGYPSWLSIVASGLNAGRLTGTPPTGSSQPPGQVTFTVRVTDSGSTSITKFITLPITGGIVPDPEPGGGGTPKGPGAG